MKKLVLGLALLVALTGHSFAQIFGPAVYATPAGSPPAGTFQVLTSTPTVLTGLSARFFPVGFAAGGGVSADFPATVFPVAGTLNTLIARAVTAPTGSQTWVITLNKNGSATGLTCTITSSVNPCALSGTNVSVVAGDYVDFQSGPTGAPTNSVIQTVVNFVPTNAGDTILMTRSAGFSTSVTQGAQPMSDGLSPGAVVNRERNLIPENGTFDKYFVNSTAPGAGTSYAYGLDINGSPVGTPSAISVTVSNTGTTGSDTTNSASVTDGQAVTFTATPTGTPASSTVAFGMRYVPATSGDFIFVGNGSITAASASANTFYSLTGTSSATEANVQSLANAMTVTKLEANVSSVVGVGKSYTFTLNDNGVATALTCQITGASATSCTSTGSVSVSAGDLLDIQVTPSGTPGSVPPALGLVAN